MAAKPTEVPVWATSGTRTDPGAGKKAIGWVSPEKPPDAFFNWLFGVTGDWLSFLDERFSTGTSSTTQMISPGGLSYLFLDASEARLNAPLAKLSVGGVTQLTADSTSVHIAGLLSINAGNFALSHAGNVSTIKMGVTGFGGIAFNSATDTMDLKGVSGGNRITVGPSVTSISTPLSIVNSGFQLSHTGTVSKIRMGNTGNGGISLDSSADLLSFLNFAGSAAVIVNTSDSVREVAADRFRVFGDGGVASDRQQPVASRYERVPNNSIAASALIDSSGGILGAHRWNVASSSKISTGVIEVVMTQAMNTGFYTVQATPHGTSFVTSTVDVISNTTFRVYSFDSTGAAVDATISVAVIG